MHLLVADAVAGAAMDKDYRDTGGRSPGAVPQGDAATNVKHGLLGLLDRHWFGRGRAAGLGLRCWHCFGLSGCKPVGESQVGIFRLGDEGLADGLLDRERQSVLLDVRGGHGC